MVTGKHNAMKTSGGRGFTHAPNRCHVGVSDKFLSLYAPLVPI
jgi:hypothetical protein